MLIFFSKEGEIMRVQDVSSKNNYSPNFGFKFRLSKETINVIERSTKLNYDELRNLPIAEAEKLMIERGSLKKPSKLKVWLSDKYRKLGEFLGLLEKRYNIYTDVD